MTLPSSGKARRTVPSLPRSLPVSTRTRSPFLILRPAITEPRDGGGAKPPRRTSADPARPVGRPSAGRRPARSDSCERSERSERVRTKPLENLWCERDDAHEPLVPQLPANGTEDAGAAGLLLFVDEDGGVLVEADVRAVGPPLLLLHADDDAPHDVAPLDRRPGDGVLHGGH